MAGPLDIPLDARILLVDLAYIGDLLMSTPAITCLRRAFPHATIDMLVAPASLPVIEHNPCLNSVRACNIKGGNQRAIREQAGLISSCGYHLAISFHRAHASLLMLRASGIPHRVGFTGDGRGLMLTRGVPFRLWEHRALNHLRLLEQGLRIEVDYVTPTLLELDPEAVAEIDRRFQAVAPGARLAAINPNASWPTKHWGADRFACVADGLADSGLVPVLIGSPKEKPVAEEVRRLMKTEPVDMTGQTTLHQLAALLARMHLIITNDSGPMHMAQALGVPVVSVFGPTDPLRCGPWGSGIPTFQADVDCIKCYRKTCWHLSCMNQIEAERVLEVARSSIRNPR